LLSENSNVKVENPTIPEMIFIKLYVKILHAKKIFNEKTYEISCIEYEILDFYYPFKEALEKKLVEFASNHSLQTA